MLPGSCGSVSSGLDGDAGSGDESDSAIARAKIDVNSSMSVVPTASANCSRRSDKSLKEKLVLLIRDVSTSRDATAFKRPNSALYACLRS